MKSHDNLRNACKTLPQFFQRVARFFAALHAEGRVFNRPLQRASGYRPIASTRKRTTVLRSRQTSPLKMFTRLRSFPKSLAHSTGWKPTSPPKLPSNRETGSRSTGTKFTPSSNYASYACDIGLRARIGNIRPATAPGSGGSMSARKASAAWEALTSGQGRPT